MTSSNINTMWRLMSQRQLQVDRNTNYDDLKCTICYKLMIDACLSTCGCQYCHKCISDYLNDKNRCCPGGKSDCNADYLVMERDVIRNMKMNNKISKLKVLCPNESCQSTMELIQIEDHLRVCSKEGAECPFVIIGCDNVDTSMDTVVNHLQSGTFTHSHLLMEYIHNLRNEVDGLKNDLTVSQGAISTLREGAIRKEIEMREIIEQMKKKMEEERREESMKTEKKMAELKEELVEVLIGLPGLGTKRETEGGGKVGKEVSALNMHVDYSWVIDDYPGKIEIMKESRIFSESFYSNNYKLCLSMSSGFGDVVELYCIIMRGDFDDTARWPMKKYVTLSLLNQDTLEAHWSGRVQYDTYIHKSAFVRPKGNIADYGIGVKLPQYSTFKNNASVVVDGSIIITCVLSDR